MMGGALRLYRVKVNAALHNENLFRELPALG
jgi:hypothetical protein